VGCIVPSGIATDDTTKYFFQDLNETHTLVSLYDFENRKKLFPAVDSRMKFSLLTLTGPERPTQQGAEFVFFAHNTEELRDEWRRFTLSAADIALINPNTRTCPIFRSRRDAELTKAVYRRVPVLVNERTEANSWGAYYMRLVDLSDHAQYVRFPWQDRDETWDVPLYEAKLFLNFDHRYSTFDGVNQSEVAAGQARELSVEEKQNPHTSISPRYFVPQDFVSGLFAKYPKYKHSWLLVWRDVARSTDARTCIVSVIPRSVATRSSPALGFADKTNPCTLVACLNSFMLDFAARQKAGGIHLNWTIITQLPVLPPATYTDELRAFIVLRVLELTYTAWDVQPFAQDCGYSGPPFVWDEARRFLLRCELDALYFHLYGISRDDAAYILDTFPIVRRKDEQQHGEYRTRRVILEMYDEMSAGVAAYTTRLDPPPGDARAAHPASE
jgi:hypothetical protein